MGLCTAVNVSTPAVAVLSASSSSVTHIVPGLRNKAFQFTSTGLVSSSNLSFFFFKLNFILLGYIKPFSCRYAMHFGISSSYTLPFSLFSPIPIPVVAFVPLDGFTLSVLWEFCAFIENLGPTQERKQAIWLYLGAIYFPANHITSFFFYGYKVMCLDLYVCLLLHWCMFNLILFIQLLDTHVSPILSYCPY